MKNKKTIKRDSTSQHLEEPDLQGFSMPPSYATISDRTVASVASCSNSTTVKSERTMNVAPMPPLEHRSTSMPMLGNSNKGRFSIVSKKPVLSSYQSTPITKHYDLNNQILSAFESHFENKLFRVAYAIGMRFVETALLEIPKHGYFYSARHNEERMSSSLEAIRVTNLLLEIQQQDEELLQNAPLEQIRLQKLQHLALEQAEEASLNQSRYEKERTKVEKELTGLFGNSASEFDFCTPLFSCTGSINDVLCPDGGVVKANEDGPMNRLSVRSADEVTHREITSQQKRHQVAGVTKLEQDLIASDRSIALPPPMRPMTEYDRVQSQPITDKEFQASASNFDVDDTVAPPPPTLDKGWIVEPMPLDRGESTSTTQRPSFISVKTSQMSFNEQLEKALYLSGLEVGAQQQQSAAIGLGPPLLVPQEFHTVDTAAHGENKLAPPPLYHNRNRTSELDDLRPTKPMRKQDSRSNDITTDPRMTMSAPATSFFSDQQAQLYQQQGALSQEEQLLYQQQRYQCIDDIGVGEYIDDYQRAASSMSAILTIRDIYHEDFESYRDLGRIRISHVDTYQGKNPLSTNGCTVIAPLLCIHHFMNTIDNSGEPDPGLPDSTIVQVLDEETPAILPKVREELGLVPNAFLIPSDAHDYLIKSSLLSQEQFVTVCGGNIMNEDHLRSLVDTLDKGTDNVETGQPALNGSSARATKKLAATLFFHEHVIAILKLERANNVCWYDIIDSLPSHDFLAKKGEQPQSGSSLSINHQPSSMMSSNNSAHEQHPSRSASSCSAFSNNSNNSSGGKNPSSDVLAAGGHSTPTPDLSNVDDDDAALQEFIKSTAILAEPGYSESGISRTMKNTARIRCLDETALSVALRWYACSKFDEENVKYIDMYPWDDMNSDFDPRVFQAFIWTEA